MTIPPDSDLIFKICAQTVWDEISQREFWDGSSHDIADGFIHFSAESQLAGTLAKHYSGQSDLVLLAIDPLKLGDQLRWEVSRGGELFPHLYGALPISAVLRVEKLPDQVG
jgi:uncharacterized protein (DUF952 family)